jgi:hypothetical protein
MKPVEKQAATSIGATLLAFAASQHHNLHMALLALGLGGSGMTFLQVYPAVRRVMLLLSVAMVTVTINSSFRRPAGPVIRVLTIGLGAVTLAVVGWSLIRFGL